MGFGGIRPLSRTLISLIPTSTFSTTPFSSSSLFLKPDFQPTNLIGSPFQTISTALLTLDFQSGDPLISLVGKEPACDLQSEAKKQKAQLHEANRKKRIQRVEHKMDAVARERAWAERLAELQLLEEEE